MAAGGSVTVILEGAATDQLVTTFLDVWDNAQLTAYPEPVTGDRAVSVKWTPPPTGTQPYEVWASCGAHASVLQPLTEVTLAIPVRCQSFDVLVVASGPIVGSIVLANASSSSVNVTGTYEAWYSTPGQVTGRPPETDLELEINAAATPTLPPMIGVASSMVDSTGAFTLKLPPVARLPVLNLTREIATLEHQQYVYRSVPADSTNLDFDLSGGVLPWITNVVADTTTRTVRWTPEATGFTPLAGEVVAARLDYTTTEGLTVKWRAIAPISHLVADGNDVVFQFPDVPGERPFEPNLSQLLQDRAVLVFHLGTAEAARALMANYERIAIDAAYTGLPGVTQVHAAIAPPP